MNAGKLNITLGCYTDAAHPNGLKVLELDEFSGSMSVCAEYLVSNVRYQALSPDGKGEVHALRYNGATGEFKVIATLGGLFRPVALCKGVNR